MDATCVSLNISLDYNSDSEDFKRAIQSIAAFGVVCFQSADVSSTDAKAFFDLLFLGLVSADSKSPTEPPVELFREATIGIGYSVKPVLSAELGDNLTDAEKLAASLFGAQLKLPEATTNAHGGAGGLGAAVIPPPPVSTIPLPAPTHSAPQPPQSVEVDINGLPWDERIHSGTRGKNANGAWRYKRGVTPITIQAVETELGKMKSLPAHSAAAPAPTTATGAPNRPAASAAATAAPQMPFIDLVRKVQAAMKEGKFAPADLAKACADVGVQDFQSMGKRPDLFGQLLVLLGIAS